MPVQLIFNTSPLMTALLAEVLLGAPPPPKLLPTLLLTIAGTGGWHVLVTVPSCMACQVQGLKFALPRVHRCVVTIWSASKPLKGSVRGIVLSVTSNPRPWTEFLKILIWLNKMACYQTERYMR